MENEIKSKMLEFLSGNEYICHLGIEIIELKYGYSKARMPYKKSILNPYGSVHGGALYSFADIVAGTAAAMNGCFAATVNGSLNYLLPAVKTEYVYCEASCIKDGKSLSVFNVKLTDDKGLLLDEGSFTFYNTGKKVIG